MRTFLFAVLLLPLLSGCLSDDSGTAPLDNSWTNPDDMADNATFEPVTVLDETYTFLPLGASIGAPFEVEEGATKLTLDFSAGLVQVGQMRIALTDPNGTEYLFHDLITVWVAGNGPVVFATGVVEVAKAIPGKWTLDVDMGGVATDAHFVIRAK